MTDDTRDLHQDTEPIGAAIQRASATVSAPSSLRATVSRQRLRQAPGSRRRHRAIVPAGAVAATVAVVVAVTSLVGGPSAAPSVASAADAALRPTTQPAPQPYGRNDRYVDRRVDGVPFPNYARVAVWRGWRTIGARDDRLGDHGATTVVYSGGGTHLAYTIVAGPALAIPGGARTVVRNGVRVAVLRRHGALAVAWRRDGHTCVMASRDANLEQLLRFATWW